MPALTVGVPNRADQIQEILMSSTGKTWKQDRVKVMAMLDKKVN